MISAEFIFTSVFNKPASVAGPGLLPEEESSPRLCKSNTSSAICRPILLTSTWLEISLSNPPLPVYVKLNMISQSIIATNRVHKRAPQIALTLRKIIIVALYARVLRSVISTWTRVAAEKETESSLYGNIVRDAWTMVAYKIAEFLAIRYSMSLVHGFLKDFHSDCSRRKFPPLLLNL